MHRLTILLLLSLMTIMITFGSCGKKGGLGEELNDSLPAQTSSIEIKGDSMLYGLSCDGTTDSVLVFWPFKGDPIVFNIEDAKHNRKIIGNPQIGDWVGVMVNPQDTTEATMVINLDQLKGTWTYPVMPVMKEFQNMSPRMQKRMEADMPDSVKQTFLVPREYGFTLKRSHVAQPVGRVMRRNTTEVDSPVSYPEVKMYKEWYVLNGRLLLVSGAPMLANGDAKNNPVPDRVDTLDFVYMDNDSLILLDHGTRIGFHRKTNAMEVHAEAAKVQAKQDSMQKNMNK